MAQEMKIFVDFVKSKVTEVKYGLSTKKLLSTIVENDGFLC